LLTFFTIFKTVKRTEKNSNAAKKSATLWIYLTS